MANITNRRRRNGSSFQKTRRNGSWSLKKPTSSVKMTPWGLNTTTNRYATIRHSCSATTALTNPVTRHYEAGLTSTVTLGTFTIESSATSAHGIKRSLHTNTLYSHPPSSVNTNAPAMINLAPKTNLASRATQNVVSVGRDSTPPMSCLHIVEIDTSVAISAIDVIQLHSNSIISTTMPSLHTLQKTTLYV